jgi:hypothetical protein
VIGIGRVAYLKWKDEFTVLSPKKWNAVVVHLYDALHLRITAFEDICFST